MGGPVRHTRTICSFPGSLATHGLFRSLLNSIIINDVCRAARACAVDSLEIVEQLEHAQ